jgi:hypothetical protein
MMVDVDDIGSVGTERARWAVLRDGERDRIERSGDGRTATTWKARSMHVTFQSDHISGGANGLIGQRWLA